MRSTPHSRRDARSTSAARRTSHRRPTLAAALACLVVLVACDTETDHAGSAELELVFNHAPVVEGVVPSPTRIDAGEATALTVTVSDPDGDPLAFAWTASCDGTFDDAEALTPTFTLVTADGAACTLTVEVRDGRGGVTEASVTITTGSPPEGSAAPVPPR